MRVLVALVTCKRPLYAANRRRCVETWAKDLPEGFDFLEIDGDTFDTGDDYDSLSEKVRWAARFARTGDYDWLLKVDDDVWMKTRQLRPPIMHYAGRVIEATDYKYCAGGCYWLSRQACEIIAKVELPLVNPSAEDQWVGRTLQAAGLDEPEWLADYVIEPCRCGECDQTIPKNWTVYIAQKSGRPPASYPPEYYERKIQ